MKRTSLRSSTTAIKLNEENVFSILIFNIHGKEYAFPVKPIQEIINYTGYTELPLMSNSVNGVVSLRGVGVPVFDLYSLLSQKKTTIGKRSCIIILNLEETADQAKKQILGLLVDSVSDVLEISEKHIEPAPHVGDKIQSDLFSGMIQVNGNFVLIINENKIFSRTENPDLIKNIIADTNKKAGV